VNRDYIDAALRALKQTMHYAKVWSFNFSGSQNDRVAYLVKDVAIEDDRLSMVKAEHVVISAYCDPRQIKGADLTANASGLWLNQKQLTVRIQVDNKLKKPWTGPYEVFVRVIVFPRP